MTISVPKITKPKSKFSGFNKWAGIICAVIAACFLFVGVSELVSGPSNVEALKPDFSNFSSSNPVSVKLDNVANIGIELVSKSRKSSTTYYYFLANVQNTKIIIETTSKNDIKQDAQINIKDSISSKTSENLSNIKTLATQNIADKSLKLSSDEVSKVKVVKHYTDSDKFFGDYWGWVAFVIFAVVAVANFVKYNRNRQIAELEEADQAAVMGNSSQSIPVVKSVASEWGINSEHFLNKKNLNQSHSQSASSQSLSFNKVSYVLLAVFLGIFGVHQFYNRKIWQGILHISWLPLFIISLFDPKNLFMLFFLAMLILPISLITSWIQAISRSFSKN